MRQDILEEEELLSPPWGESGTGPYAVANSDAFPTYPEVERFEGTKPQIGWVAKSFFDPSDAPDMIFIARCAYCYTDPGTGTCCPRQIEASRGVSTFP